MRCNSSADLRSSSSRVLISSNTATLAVSPKSPTSRRNSGISMLSIFAQRK
jgi:hypothetical protein